MSVAIAQKKASTTGSNVSSLAVTFNSSTTTGNLIVVSSGCWDSDATAPTNFTVTDSKSNAYTQVQGQGFSGAGPQMRLEQHYAKNVTGGASHQVTVTPGDSVFMTIGIFELSGADTAAPLDSSAKATGASTTPSVGVTPGADGLMIAAMSNNGAVMNPDGAWTEELEIDQSFSAFPQNILSRAATNGAADSADWTLNATQPWGAIVGNYKAAGAGGATVSLLYGLVACPLVCGKLVRC